jgi:hypothetical protein
MLVKDEADVVEFTVRHLLGHVDQLLVRDNGSSDGTAEILDALADQADGRLVVQEDSEVGYYQAAKTSELARLALELGHSWVVPCDADEFWYATDGRPIRDYLAGLAPDVAYVTAPLFNHLPTALDPPAFCLRCAGSGREPREGTWAGPEGGPASCTSCRGLVTPNPFRRLGWRQREHGALPKVACRLRPGLEIRQGNHSAYAPGGGLSAGGLVVRHFSWRSEEQYLRKIVNGAAAYAATDLPADTGAHWRAFGNPPDEAAVRGWFRTWGWQENPAADDSLLYDPAPWSS